MSKCLQVGGAERRYHVVITAQGSAVHWQARVHYYWYRKVRHPLQCRGERLEVNKVIRYHDPDIRTWREMQ